MRARLMTVLAFGLLGACAPSGATGMDLLPKHENDNYGLSVAFPPNVRVCTAYSGDAPHGFHGVLHSARECAADPLPPSAEALSVWASFNTTFITAVADVLPGPCLDEDAVKGFDLRLGGRTSAACLTRSADGSFHLAVATQGGRWPGGAAEGEFASPYVNYVATLRTPAAPSEAQLALFRRYLASIEIRQPSR